MNTSAIVMMIIATSLLWGGLIASIIHLRANPDSPEDDETGDDHS